MMLLLTLMLLIRANASLQGEKFDTFLDDCPAVLVPRTRDKVYVIPNSLSLRQGSNICPVQVQKATSAK